MNFHELLLRAKNGEKDARQKIWEMYQPLLVKESVIFGVFDEDVYQDLSEITMHCIDSFKL